MLILFLISEPVIPATLKPLSDCTRAMAEAPPATDKLNVLPTLPTVPPLNSILVQLSGKPPVICERSALFIKFSPVLTDLFTSTILKPLRRTLRCPPSINRYVEALLPILIDGSNVLAVPVPAPS